MRSSLEPQVTLTLEWTVASVEPKPSLEGDIVVVEGRAIDDERNVYVTGRGSNLVRAPLRGDL